MPKKDDMLLSDHHASDVLLVADLPDVDFYAEKG